MTAILICARLFRKLVSKACWSNTNPSMLVGEASKSRSIASFLFYSGSIWWKRLILLVSTIKVYLSRVSSMTIRAHPPFDMQVWFFFLQDDIPPLLSWWGRPPPMRQVVLGYMVPVAGLCAWPDITHLIKRSWQEKSSGVRQSENVKSVHNIANGKAKGDGA